MSYNKSKVLGRFKTHNPTKSQLKYVQQTFRVGQNNHNSALFNPQMLKSVDDNSTIIIEKMQKHIEYVQKRLRIFQDQVKKLQGHNDQLKERLISKQKQNHEILVKMNQLELAYDDLAKSYHRNTVDQCQNHQLLKKIDQLTHQMSIGKELNRTRHKKGKFSAAFLPAGFDSQFKVKTRNIQQFDSLIKNSSFKRLNRDSGSNLNILNEQVMNEWRKTMQVKTQKQKQAAELQEQNKMLIKEVSSQKSLLSNLKNEVSRKNLQHSNQVVKLKNQLKQLSKDNKILSNQLNSNEQNIEILTQKVKNQDQFFQIIDLKQTAKRQMHNLQIQICIVDLSILPQPKMPLYNQISTQKAQQMRTLTDRILQLQKQLQNSVNKKDQQKLQPEFSPQIQCQVLQQSKQKNCQIIRKDQEKNQKQYIQNPYIEQALTQMVDQQVSCQIIPNNFNQYKEQILEKVSQLMSINQDQNIELVSLKQMYKQAQRQLAFKNAKNSDMICIQTQTQIEANNVIDTQVNPEYQDIKNQLVESLEQCQNLMQKLETAESQRQHFNLMYNQTLTKLNQLQTQNQIQMKKISQQLNEKQIKLITLMAQSEQQQLNSNQTIEDLELRIKSLQIQLSSKHSELDQL